MEKVKTKADFNIIKKLFGVEPIEWARYEDGRLSFISPTGQKFVYDDEMLQEIAEEQKAKAAAASKAAKKKAAPKPEKSAPVEKDQA